MKNKKALIVVDMQNDFVSPNGKLYVKNAEKIVNKINKKINKEKSKNNLIILSRDWHPKNNISFKQWGEHCLENTWGSEFAIDSSKADLIINKGTKVNSDSYSAFYVNEDELSNLNDFLVKNNIKKLEIIGVAYDVCVKETYKDAVRFQYKTKIIKRLTKKIKK